MRHLYPSGRQETVVSSRPMNVTDGPRATSAAVLVLAGLAANVGLTVLSYAVNAVSRSDFDSPIRLVEEGLWLIAVGVLVMGLLNLSAAVDEPVWLRAAALTFIVHSLLDLANTLLMTRLGLSGPVISDVSMLLLLGARGLLIFCIVRLTMKDHAWVMPLLGTVVLLTLMRTAFSVASIHHLAPTDFYLSPVFRLLFPAVSLFNATAMVFSAFALKASVSAAGGGPSTAQLVADAGLRPGPATPVAPAADFLVGGILLAVGIGVTFVSLAAASNGGRYVVATGAIAVGVGRIIRGFIRLGRSG